MDRLLDRLEADGALGQAGDGEHAGDGAGGEDEGVVVQVDGGVVGEGADPGGAGLVVDGLDLADDEAGAVEHPAEGDDDVAGLDGAGGGLGEERLVLEVVLGVDQHDLVLGPSEPALEAERGVGADEPAPAHEDPHGVPPAL